MLIHFSSDTDPNKFETIPFHQRALKYLLSQLHNTEIAAAENAGEDDNIPKDDGDDDWEEEDDMTQNDKEEMAWLSDMLAGGGKTGNWDDFEDDMGGQDDDEDLMNDDLMKVNMAVSVIFMYLARILLTLVDNLDPCQSHIVNGLRQAYANNTNHVQELCNRLTDLEKAIMSQKVLSM